MASVSQSILIERPAATVFSAIEDPSVQMTFDDMFRGVDKLTDGPIGRGTRFRGDFRGMGKVEYEYVEFESGRLIVHGVKMPFGQMQHRFELSPDGSATRLTQSIGVEPNLLGKVMWPLILRGKMEQRITTLNGLIKRFVESRP